MISCQVSPEGTWEISCKLATVNTESRPPQIGSLPVSEYDHSYLFISLITHRKGWHPHHISYICIVSPWQRTLHPVPRAFPPALWLSYCQKSEMDLCPYLLHWRTESHLRFWESFYFRQLRVSDDSLAPSHHCCLVTRNRLLHQKMQILHKYLGAWIISLLHSAVIIKSSKPSSQTTLSITALTIELLKPVSRIKD